MDKIYFLIRYIPFWAVPVFLLGLEFAYLSWMRKKKKFGILCLSLSAFSLALIVFYYWVGGPERAARYVFEMIQYYK